MTGEDIARVEALEARLGYAFPDRALALTALTHKSWANENQAAATSDNERLEFLGDAVVDLAVSKRLMERLPDAREGELSRIRAALVNAESLAELAGRLDLGALLRLGRGEERTGGREKQSLLANGVEAVFGAVYLADGFAPAVDLVDRHLLTDARLESVTARSRDYKTRLQERLQAGGGASPRYRVTAEDGPDHEKTFAVEVHVESEVLGRGEGRSKKEAEQAAAQEALTRLDAQRTSGETQ